MSVLYVSHGHPTYAKGGGELAAWRLFEAFRNKPEYEDSGFLAAAPSAEVFSAGCELVGISKDEWLIKRSTSAITHDTAVNLSEGGQLHQALEGKKFRLIHLHHYLHVGIDLIFGLKRWFPQAKLLLTMHDYWGPCVYEGRLLRTSGELCQGGDPTSCNACIGGNHQGEIAIRALRLKRMFGVIDHLICPSYFLKRQYLNWGVDPQTISVMENIPDQKVGPINPKPASGLVPETQLVVGYFGQINPWKGLDLIIKGLAMARAEGADVNLQVHGPSEDLSNSPEGVTLAGAYSPEQLGERMAGIDLLVMGSIWYENSPMVIQEAYRYRRAVLLPNLGGMAEKVKEGCTGLLFDAGDSASLARCLVELYSNRKLLTKLTEGVEEMMAKRADALRGHQQIYARLMKA